MLSIPHMVVIFLVALVVFGPQKLPELARSLCKLMAEFRKASTDFRSAFEEEMRDLERQAREVQRKQAEAALAPVPALPPSEVPGSESPAPESAAASSAAEPSAGDAPAAIPETVARSTEPTLAPPAGQAPEPETSSAAIGRVEPTNHDDYYPA